MKKSASDTVYAAFESSLITFYLHPRGLGGSSSRLHRTFVANFAHQVLNFEDLVTAF